MIGWRRRFIRSPSSSWPITFLGPPQTTRQSRTLALLGMIGAVALLRLTGFVSVIVGVHVPSVLAVQYVALFGAIAGGLWQISRGRAVEPAAAVSKFATAISDRIARATRAEERTMITGTLSRYFGMRFLTSVVGSFIGVVALAAMIDYVELMRRGADWPNATALVLAKISMYPRAAAHRTHHAVLGAGRRDVVLPVAVAPP